MEVAYIGALSEQSLINKERATSNSWNNFNSRQFLMAFKLNFGLAQGSTKEVFKSLLEFGYVRLRNTRNF